MSLNNKISIVIPCFNESLNISKIINEIENVFAEITYDFELIFVDDGSIDDSVSILKTEAENKSFVKYIEFSRNFGKDQALKAGIDIAKGDALVTIDADLQHPPALIKEMIKKWENGYEVIYAFRKENNPDASFKNRIGSKVFYKLVNYLSDINLENGIADYRLMDKKVIKSLKNINEYELFLRGMVKWIGFKQIGIPYIPEQRFAGESTYSIKLLIKLALHGITSFSTKPLYLSIYLGFLLSGIGFLFYCTYVFYSLFYSLAISGWASVIFTIVFFGGLNLIVLGIVGIYVGKIFMQSKGRPNYLIKETNYK
ncbi:glycosyltransferase family 2 protein [Flavobacterium psychrophilum]|uniref:glycosyltransferase family 2 protein n=1 Tax=Flavobacterium psychrophilum TaxID=96345 RepID=UPI00106BF2F6|nr:glycosyltransferase family 2 protein [Flavobacterium psychrophilum]EKT3956853.1 glycosyltransferase family 2 protein [Flavobacterium psychrophilum]QRE60528.1 glycosyltransferase family 2 protein [Flavobacterium psychrophilum]QRE62715.1 glycosyltransferase family 2 protein [Flavobacterium psychrophilum]